MKKCLFFLFFLLSSEIALSETFYQFSGTVVGLTQGNSQIPEYSINTPAGTVVWEVAVAINNNSQLLSVLQQLVDCNAGMWAQSLPCSSGYIYTFINQPSSTSPPPVSIGTPVTINAELLAGIDVLGDATTDPNNPQALTIMSQIFSLGSPLLLQPPPPPTDLYYPGLYMYITSSKGGSMTTHGPMDTWYIRYDASPGPTNFPPFDYGTGGLIPISGDWSGQGWDTIGTFDPSTATWYLRNTNGPGSATSVFQYGGPGTIPVVGDWTGSGKIGIGVFTPANGLWQLRNTPNAGPADITFQYGAPKTVPVVGDWAGTGATGIGVYTPATGTWQLRNTASPGVPDNTFQYGGGVTGEIPITGDWQGTGQTGIGIFVPGTATWYLRDTANAGPTSIAPFVYGWNGVIPLTGAWGGGGQTGIAIVNPAGN
jgi:hypothetical protein